MRTVISTAVILLLTYIALTVAEENATKITSDAPLATTTSPPKTTKLLSESTTTPAPKSTTTLPPEPKPSLWYVTDKSNNNTCILLEAGIRLTFNYLNTSYKTMQDFPLDVPTDIENISGQCGASEQYITLRFFKDWSLTFHVVLNKTVLVYQLASINITYKITPDRFPNAIPGNITIDTQELKAYDTEEGMKYVCVASQMLIQRNATVGLTSLTTYTLSLEAFRNSTSHAFTKSATHCPHDEVSQLVPIIVGACLAGLIVIVLIAYVIGRQRSRGGYASV